jgi:hypothetical protein
MSSAAFNVGSGFSLVRAEHFGPLTELFQPGRPGRIGPGASTKARPLAARTGLHYTK